MYSFASGTDALMTCGTTELIMDMKVDYPDNYGGACYNAYDSNKLDIYLTDNDTSDYLDVLDVTDVKFHIVDYTIEELIAAKDLISERMSDYSIKAIALIQKDNKILITANPDFSKSNFYDLADSLGIPTDMFTIEISDNKNDSTISAYAGSGVKAGGYTATVGFNAYRSQTKQYGIVTAGHLLADISNDTKIYANDCYVNTKSNAKYYYKNSSCDAAFIPFTSGQKWGAVNLFGTNGRDGQPGEFGSIISYTYVNSALEGTCVTKYGDVSGKKTGTILSTSADFEYVKNGETRRITDTIYSMNYNISGDSGAPVGIVTGSNTPYKMSIVGIATGTDSRYYQDSEKSIGVTYSSKITNIIGPLGLKVIVA